MERLLKALAGALVCAIGFIAQARGEDSAIFEKPVRLQADGKDIDTGDALGHSGPCLADFDGDGLRDLIVGDHSGKFRVYKNIGTKSEPKYTASGYLQADKEDAKVPIYCCIGSSPQLADFDNDGKVDLISGSYDPGECYLFRGVGPGKFATRETLVDKSGKPILRHSDQKQKYQSFGSWPVVVDWNNDDKPDLLIGGFDGTIFVRLNEGTREKPAFSEKNIVVQAGGKDLKLPSSNEASYGHAAISVADWDGDGRWDIISGNENGSVWWFRGVGEAGAPRFEEATALIPPHNGDGYDEILETGAEPVPGIRSQVWAGDYNGDGKTDLLLGDFCTTVTPRPDLTEDERKELQALRHQAKEIEPQESKLIGDARRVHNERYPGEAAYTDEAVAEWAKAYQAVFKTPEYKALNAKTKQLDASMEKYLVKPPQEGQFTPYATTHGYVWLFLRK